MKVITIFLFSGFQSISSGYISKGSLKGNNQQVVTQPPQHPSFMGFVQSIHPLTGLTNQRRQGISAKHQNPTIGMPGK